MATTAGISIEQYLKTSYTPDCEYIHGELKEKTGGDLPHGIMQPTSAPGSTPTHASGASRSPSQPEPESQTVKCASLIWSSFLSTSPLHKAPSNRPRSSPSKSSPDDSYNDLRPRARDLRAMGTANIWLIDPAEKTIAVWGGLTWQPFQGDKLQATGIAAYLDPAWLWTEFA